MLLALAGAVSGCREADFGAGELPPCRGDSACADTSGCNGEERCIAGRCEPGEPVACRPNLVCANREGEASCEFEEQSPWLIFTDDVEPGFFGQFGIPAALIGQAEPFDLNGTVSSEKYIGVYSNEWSPDGRYMLFDPVYPDYSAHLYWMEFGAGLPTDGRPVTNLPDVGVWSVIQWSRDSRRVLLQEYDSAEFYLLDFADGEPRPSRVVGVVRVGFCGEGIVAQAETAEIHHSLDFGEAERELLGTGEVELLPDGEHVLISDQSGETYLVECMQNAQRHELGDTRSIQPSGDSEFLAFQSPVGLVVISVDDGQEVVLPTDVSHATGWMWSGDGARLLVTNVSQMGRSLKVVDVRAGAVMAEIPISVESEAAWLAPDLVLIEPMDAFDHDLHVWRVGYDLVPLDDCNRSNEIIGSEDGATVVCLHLDEKEGSRVMAVDVGNGGSIRELWRDQSPELRLDGFSPDEMSVVVQSIFFAEKTFSQLWWVPVSPDAEVSPLQINRGDFALTSDPWQPGRGSR
jgi:hypothetical protein